MRVFVAGATGVLGRALVPRLRARGHTVRALARSREPETASRDTGVEWFRGDLLAADAPRWVPRALDGCDAAVHAATAIPSDPRAPDAWEVNSRLRIEGTRVLLDACLAAVVRVYVQQSIVMAYRDGGDAWLTEDWPLDTSPERATICGPVIEMEAQVRGTPLDRLRWTILRGGAFTGPGTAQDALLGSIGAGRATIPGRGQAYLSPIHVADMAGAVAQAVEAGLPGATLNVVDEPIRQAAYYNTLAELLGVPRPPVDDQQGELPSFRCANSAAREALGWRPMHDIWPNSASGGKKRLSAG